MSRTLIWSKIKWIIDHCQKYQIQCIFTSPLPKKALHYFENITIWCRFHHLQLHAWWVSDPSDKWRHQNRGDSWVVHCSLGHCKGSICVNNKSSLKNNLLANMTYLTCYRYMTIIKNLYVAKGTCIWFDFPIKGIRFPKLLLHLIWNDLLVEEFALLSKDQSESAVYPHKSSSKVQLTDTTKTQISQKNISIFKMMSILVINNKEDSSG